MISTMDELLKRAALAIADSQALQHHWRLLFEEQRFERVQLRRSVLESAQARVESKAMRENGQP
ncbi:hypothetical protein XI04_26785 [Bradyrhizobium sp. CCBAU 11430]|nr:hypothetical protein [Bradyrhizobium sp. CCBAU 25360]MDA9516634.1 hypothetical protein [Bradyrhizobium sp. CCBAU 11430]